MKRALSLILVVVMMCGLLCSCGKSDEQTLTPNSGNETVNATEVETTAKPAEVLSDKNSKISIEGLFDAELADVYFTDEIEEEVAGITHGFPAQNDGVLAVLEFKVSVKSTKELQEHDITSNEVLIYDETYEYSGGVTAFTDLTPLSEGLFYIYYEVPPVVEKGKEPVVAHFTIEGNEYTVNIR